MKPRALIQLRSLAAHPLSRWVGLPALCAVALVIAWAQSVPVPLPPTVNLASEPLYARGARAKPTLTLALSVEFPTVGAQYVGTPRATDDASYSPSEKYIGYFDTESCYRYERDASTRHFARVGAAVERTCGGTAFSGNFMNWATSSAIDVLRLGLTGGDRVVDEADLTVLQRAVLPARDTLPGKNDTFWNGVNFPSKQVSGKVALGALPVALIGDNPGTIYIANCLNRIYFGTNKDGSCDSPGDNGNLGGDVNSVPTAGMYQGALPSDFGSAFAGETYPGVGPSYSVTGSQQIAYGSGSTWAIITKTGGSVACSNEAWATYGVPGLAANGDPFPNVAKECRRRSAPTTDAASGPKGGLTPDMFFYARVKVCDSSNGVLTDPRPDLCQRYPHGNYKPVGNLQKHSDSVRVAVFSYLSDNSDDPQRSGGVLRAPMKYVGPRAYDTNFNLVPEGNSAQEWADDTGVFNKNPDNAGSPNSGESSSAPGQPMSGVINYLNQFGRTGDVLGRYKTYDPVSELYYESLRYLQGLQPTQIGSSIATNVVVRANDYRDGFPVYTNYDDPHPAVANMTDYSCVRNSIVGIGDVNTWNDKFIPGNPSGRTGRGDTGRDASDAKNEPDFWKWTQVVGGFESNKSVGYTDGAGVSGRTTSNPNTPNEARWGMENQGIGSEGSATYYIAGMAYWANTHDIRGKQWTAEGGPGKQRPGMRVTTYWIDVNEFGEQSDPAKRRANNQFYLAAKYGGFKDVTGTGNPYKKRDATGAIVDDLDNLNWERKSSNPDLQEAKNYFLASSAQSVIDALNEIFKNITAEANSIAGAAISSSQVTDSASALVYQAKFDPTNWSGDVVAYPLQLSSDQTQLVIGEQISDVWAQPGRPAVGVAGKLDAMNANARNIYVGYRTESKQTFGSSVFIWDKVVDSVKQALHAQEDDPTTSDQRAQNRLNYLRGDRTLEAGGSSNSKGTFRQRQTRLGDIVNSGIVYVAGPSRAIADASYASFYDSAKSRVPTLYVGANDGMLHAFSAATGDELFAYIPSWVVPNLIELTKPSYKHRSYVDATPAVAEANLGTSASADWRTVLVGGTGGGGQGVYALDVSDPGGFDNDHVLWEFTDQDDADLGNVIGTPRILKMNIAAGSTPPDYRYFAVVASGVNNHAADGHASTTGEPALFFLQLGKGKTDAWVLGSNYYKVKFPVITSDTALPSGLINFTARGDLNGAVTYLYAGDLQGNLWKLDFRATPASAWSLGALSPFKSVGGAVLPLFVATDGVTTAPKRQPITMAPSLTFGPLRNSIIVSFGTGRYLSEDDNRSPFRTQSVYGVLDNNTNTVDSPTAEESNLPEAAIMGRGRLRQLALSSSSLASSPFIWGRPSAADAESLERAGWYFDFDQSGTTATSTGTGERQIGGFVVQGGRLIFGSVIPAVNSCDNGSGVQYQVSVLTGNGSAIVSTLGVLGEPLLVQLGGNVPPGISDPTGRRVETTTKQALVPTSGGLTGTSPFTYTRPTGRLSWREISNYQDLRNAP